MAAARGSILERDKEMALATEALDAAAAGSGRVVMVRGPAGIGKTRLLGELREVAPAKGVRLLPARGGELERQLPWGVARQMFDPVLGPLGAAERDELFAGAGSLAASIFAGGTAAPAESGRDLAALVYGLYWVVTGLAAREPLALVLDDAHWADEQSLEWLAFLGPRLDGLAASIFVAVRTGDPDSDRTPLTQIAASPESVVVEPAPLSADGAAELISAIAGTRAEPEFVAASQEVAGGNPFLLQELTRQLTAEHVEPTGANAGRVSSLRPGTISRSVFLRLARLPADATALARAVAVLGPGQEARDAAALAELDGAAAADAHSALVEAHILAAGMRPEFVHPLVATAIYEELPALDRARWHERAAHVLDAAGAGPDAVAPHLLASSPGTDLWVRQTLRAAARSALQQGSPDLAGRLLRRAQREAAGGDDEHELLFELGRADFAAIGAPGLEALEAALAAAPDPERLVTVALELGRALHTVGNHPRAAEIYRQAWESLADGPDPLRRLMRAHYMYTGVQASDSFPGALAALGEAAGEIGPGDRADDIAHACLALATAAGGAPGAPAIAEQALASGWLMEERTPALSFAIMALIWSDELPRAGELWDEGLRLAREAGEVPWMSFAACFRALVASRAGDIPLAEAFARDAFAAADIWDLIPPDPASFLCDALVEQGRLDEAQQTLDACGYDPELPERQGYNSLLWSRARLALAQGKRDAAIDDLRELGRRTEAMAIMNPAAFAWRSALAEALGDAAPDEAAELAAAELEKARAFGAPRAIGIALRASGLASRDGDQIDRLREAVDVLEESRARLELARARTSLGGALRRHGHRSEARDVLRTAVEEARRCGAHALAEQAEAELLTAGARPRRGALRGRDELTASETRVARLAADGASNREIAQTLFVTLRTVETHLTSVYRKLDISARDELARKLKGPDARTD